MKSIHFVFVLLLIIAGITAYIFMAEQPPGATGLQHTSINGLSVGGDRGSQVSALGNAPYYFQVAVILLAGAMLYMGIAPHRRDAQLKLFFAVGLGFALFVWTMVYTGYEAYLATGESNIAFGFPVPTTWMLWGIWGSFVVFDLFYVVAFRRYFLPKEDEAAFDALVREIKSEQEAL
ncbi:hypothetical protein [Kordiimonas aquimaris]|uniref:hypothetical protein n=1 Tax=Kordiimonas aquimaris TaxID=707591 RepID=UPI0021CF56B4|nr:hypothetical protein [Kordiimonas aquimaris]